MSWILSKLFRFEASHQLPRHNGKCARLHGHSWVGKVFVEGGTLVEGGSSSGMVVDYSEISLVVTPFVDRYLDHRHLNDTTGLENPTSEELARWIYNCLKPQLEGLVGVEIQETCTCSCMYRPDQLSDNDRPGGEE